MKLSNFLSEFAVVAIVSSKVFHIFEYTGFLLEDESDYYRFPEIERSTFPELHLSEFPTPTNGIFIFEGKVIEAGPGDWPGSKEFELQGNYRSLTIAEEKILSKDEAIFAEERTIIWIKKRFLWLF